MSGEPAHRPTAADDALRVVESAGRLTCENDRGPLLEAVPAAHGRTAAVQTMVDDTATGQAAAAALFVARPALQALSFSPDVPAGVDPASLYVDEHGQRWLERAAAWQVDAGWLVQPAPVLAEVFTVDASTGRRHPRRPPIPPGLLYRRFDTGIDAWFSLRTLDLDADLALFNQWQNSPRIAPFWEEAGDLEAHRAYLSRLEADPRIQALIGCIDDEPFAYFEVYWAKEDRIAPYCEPDDYDRGIHMLVGNDRHRGPHKVKAWLNGLCHYLFLADPRTRRIVSEPSADNDRMIDHLMARRFARLKEFDFPHKRAALMMLSREAFFERCELE